MAVTSDKSNMLCILKVLQEYSDENNILTVKDIIGKMSVLYDRKVDRRTIYSAIEALQEFGYDISTYADNNVGYYLIDREFTTAEVKLLIDAIFSCEYISQKQTEELLQKLRSFLSVHERKNYNYTNIIAPDKKSPNPEVFLNIEILDQAINSHKQVAFTYLDYDYDKKLKPRRDQEYVVNPYSMICEGNHYYLVLISKGHADPSFYRIDMMKNIRILDDDIEISKRDAKLDSIKKVVYAHTGEPQRVELRCDKQVLRYVIEEFGKDVVITKNADGSFNASFLTATEGLVYWALQYLQHVEVISPKEVRERVIEAINSNKYK
ncbi:MAG: WYL domain-containing protein [Clostridia bacterium]|nr:WYL domain-containing protein [Clostridia bacterium]